MYTFFTPAKPALKLSDKFNVSTVPAIETLDPAPFSVHWLFCWLPLPGAIVPVGAVAASVNSTSVFAARPYDTQQALPPARAELINTVAVFKSAAPALS